MRHSRSIAFLLTIATAMVLYSRSSISDGSSGLVNLAVVTAFAGLIILLSKYSAWERHHHAAKLGSDLARNILRLLNGDGAQMTVDELVRAVGPSRRRLEVGKMAALLSRCGLITSTLPVSAYTSDSVHYKITAKGREHLETLYKSLSPAPR